MVPKEITGRAAQTPAGPAALPLVGLVVLDFAQFLAGPSCALRLADLGAVRAARA